MAAEASRALKRNASREAEEELAPKGSRKEEEEGGNDVDEQGDAPAWAKGMVRDMGKLLEQMTVQHWRQVLPQLIHRIKLQHLSPRLVTAKSKPFGKVTFGILELMTSLLIHFTKGPLIHLHIPQLIGMGCPRAAQMAQSRA